jgi:uncharacterized RDD family membrane protein YckC
MVSHPDPGMDTAGEVLGERVVALAIDAVLLGLAWFLVWGAGAAVRLGLDGSLSLLDGGVSVVGAAVWAGTWMTVLGVGGGYLAGGYLLAGQTIGQRMTDLVVVSGDGDPPDQVAALLRAGVRLAPVPVVAVLALALGFVGVVAGAGLLAVWLLVDLVAVLLDDDGRSLGDQLADTVVVSEAVATI